MTPAIKLCRAPFELCCILIVGYVLNRGFYIGSFVDYDKITDQYRNHDGTYYKVPGGFYRCYCRYITVSGLEKYTSFSSVYHTREEAEGARQEVHCRAFRDH
jgi:hypothetical protein